MSNDTRRNVGSVYRIDSGRWCARIQNGVRADGTPRRKPKVFDTKAEAESWIAQQAYELGIRGDLFAGVTLAKLWPIYAKSRADALTKKTIATYKWNIERIWLPPIGDMDVTMLTPATVQRILDTLTHENAKHAKTALSVVLSWAVREDIIKSNPIRGHTFAYPAKVTQESDYDDDYDDEDYDDEGFGDDYEDN